MSRPLGFWSILVVLMIAATAVACGPGGSVAATASPTGADRQTPGPEASPSPDTSAPTATGAAGAALATVRIGDAETVIGGGRCGVFEFPADLGGGYGFSLNLGVMNFEDGGPDYLGVVFDVPGLGDEANGTYEMTWGNATGTLVAAGKYIRLGDIVLTIAGGGAEGTITSVVRDEETPVEITFTC